MEGNGEETLRIRLHEGEPRNTLCNMDYTSKDGSSQTNLTCQEHDLERIVEKIVDVRVPLSILEETVAVMKLDTT